MALITLKPTSAGRRSAVRVSTPGLHKGAPYAPLTESQNKTGGRNHYGRITTRHKGGGSKQHYRIIDFKRDKEGIACRIERLEYDPNRTSHIALLLYADGERRYILAPDGLKVGEVLTSGAGSEQKAGNCMPLRNILEGTFVHAVELKIGKGAAMARSAGAYAQLVAKEGDYATLKLPSREMRLVHLDCRATIGQVGNLDHMNLSYGKAGRMRWLGRRPHNRGVAMNPIDHPLGGGEGKSSGGRHPVSPWGKPTKGHKTRRNKRTQGMIVRRRTK